MKQDTIKKFSIKFLMSLILLSIFIPFLIILTLLAATRHGDILFYLNINTLLPVSIISIFISFAFWCMNISWGHLQSLFMKHTFKKKVKGIFPYDDYYYGSYNYIFINAKEGKIGIITSMNPFAFQIISADAVNQWSVDTRPLGQSVSRGVRLILSIGNQRIGIETLITNGTLFMSSDTVKEGIEKAEDLGQLLDFSKQNAIAIKNGTYDIYNDLNAAENLDEHETHEDYRIKYHRH